MKTLLYLLASAWGAVLLYRGLAEGLPGPPFTSREWGALAAFGFGALLVLVGLRHVWQRLAGDDAALGGGSSLLLVVLAVAVTGGAVAWRGGAGGSSRECAEVLDHVQGLFAAREGAEAARARFEELRPSLLQRCQQMPSDRRRCPLQATSLEEFQRCP